METLTIDLKKKKSFEIGQQGDHNALCIHFINMKNIGTNKKYIYYTIDGIENCVPLTNDRFIIGYPLTAHSGIASAQLISKLNDNSIIKLSNVFAMNIKESKGYKDSGEYPVDPNIQFSYDLLDDLINETKDMINNYNYATLMEKLTQASSEATTSAATAKKCADELKNSTDFINTLDDKVAAQDSKIENIEASTSHITTKQNTKIAALHTRMSEFTSLKDGSTTGDAELIDARIGADGTKYASAGDAMRGQVERINDDKVDKLGIKQVSKVNADFIISDMLVDIPQKKWKNEQQSSYHYESIVKSDISFRGTDVRIYIGSSTNPDRNTIAVVNMYEKGKEDYTVSTILTESDLGKWSGELTSNGATFNKLEIRLYSSFATVLEPNTETIINDIKVTTTGSEGKYKLNGVFVDKDDIVDNTPDTTIITVKSDGTGDYTNPVKATNDIFNRAYNGEKFIIQIYEGTYDIYASWEDVNKNGWFVTGANIGWNTHANIKLIGIGDRDKIICNCFLPDNSDPELVIKASCINANFGAYMENITFVAKNTRYCCHSDNANYYKNLTYDIKNCVFKHLGNKEGFWSYHGGWVEGSSSGNTYKFEDCEFIGARRGYGTHTNNQQSGFTTPCSHKFVNCKFINKGSAEPSISFECMGSGVMNRVYFNGCYIETGLKMGQNPSDAGVDIEIMMSGCSSIPIEKTSDEMKIYVM